MQFRPREDVWAAGRRKLELSRELNFYAQKRAVCESESQKVEVSKYSSNGIVRLG